MQKSIAAIIGASLAVLLVTASVAAADPFGWRAGGQTTAGNGIGYGWSGNSYGGSGNSYGGSAAATAVPTASQPAATAQPTARPSATSVPRHQASNSWSGTQDRTTQRQTTQHHDRHGSDWCDDYGRDDHDSYWH